MLCQKYLSNLGISFLLKANLELGHRHPLPAAQYFARLAWVMAQEGGGFERMDSMGWRNMATTMGSIHNLLDRRGGGWPPEPSRALAVSAGLLRGALYMAVERG